MFTQEFIDSIRQSSGDEAAQELIDANIREHHGERVKSLLVDQDQAKSYPRLLDAVKNGIIEIPVTAGDDELQRYCEREEKRLEALHVPLPGTPAPPAPAPTSPPTESAAPQPVGRTPWSQGNTQSIGALAPLTPGPQPNEDDQLVTEIEGLLDPEEGQFRNKRDRDRQLIEKMETAQQHPRAKAGLHEMVQRRQSPKIFS